jgi:UMF1 family MFS transporter
MELARPARKKAIRAWVFYDWANSVYSLVISTAIFPIYYSNITTVDGNDKVEFLGGTFSNTALYSYVLSLSFLIVVVISPLLSGIADYSSRKKSFLRRFCYLGGTSVALLFFFRDVDTLWIGLLGTMFASVGFWGSHVFYNAYLPEIAPKRLQDHLSARGFAMGYFGSSILMILLLVIIQMPEVFGFADAGIATRFSFLIVAVWWVGFAQITFKGLPDPVEHKSIHWRTVGKGYKQLKTVWDSLQGMKNTKRFLVGFFLLSIGVQTVILLAAPFGTKELGLGATEMIITILVIQFVAIGGSLLFSKLSERFGNITALLLSLVIWVFITFSAWTMEGGDDFVNYKFYALGACVGLVLGGVQALSRSTYSKMLPKEGEHTTYFSFYDITEKLAIVIGTFTFGFVEEISGSMYNSA